MSLKSILFGAAAAMTLALPTGNALAADGALSPEQKQEMEQLVRDYILEHPEVVIEAVARYQEQEAQRAAERQQQSILENLDALQADPGSPFLGNPNGDVVLVEFFDYRCPYCHKAAKVIEQLLDSDPNLKVVFKEFPILSNESVIAARAALAAFKQGKYGDYHFSLMKNAEDLSLNRLRALAAKLDLDMEQFDTDMRSAAVGQNVLNTKVLAQKLELSGTPAFVLQGQMVPPGTTLAQFKQLIADIRAQAGS